MGKTSLAKRAMVEQNVPFVSTDVLTHALGRTYPSTHLRGATWTETPDLFFPFLQQFIRYTQKCISNYLIEGAAIYPSHVATLMRETTIRACFLGTSVISLRNIEEYASVDDWVSPLDEHEKHELPQRILEFSKLLESETSKLGIPYFDVGDDRNTEMQAAYNYLFNQGD